MLGFFPTKFTKWVDHDGNVYRVSLKKSSFEQNCERMKKKMAKIYHIVKKDLLEL